MSTFMNKLKLRLFITGQTPRAERALTNLHRICSEELEGKYELEIIDVLEHPQLAEEEKILATPTLIRELPLPPRRVIGDLSDRKQVLRGLDLQTGVEDATSSGESP
jgi:circadian clock protein KaiB